MSGITWQRSLLALAIVVLVGAEAHADQLLATRGEPLVEVSHDVSLRIDEGVAVYTVRRTLANLGQRHEQAYFDVELPHGGAITGLRIRAADRWYDGELMEREAARELYRELTGVGPHEPRDPALMEWRWADRAALHVFPVVPGRANTVEYTITAPTRYVHGRLVATYMRTDDEAKNLAVPTLRVTSADPRALVQIGDRPAALDQAVVLAAPRVDPWLQDAALGDSDGHAVSAIEVDVDAAISELTVEVDIRHTYRGDLTVTLYPPAGEPKTLFENEDGGENDLQRRFDVKLDAPVSSRGTWRLVASDQAGMDTGSLDTWSVAFHHAGAALERKAADTPQFIPDARADGSADVVPITVTPGAIDVADARLGRVVAGAGKAFTRVEIDAAPQLTPLPKDHAVVFVVDGSRSTEDGFALTAGRVIAGYLAHVPDAAAQVVVFRRDAKALFDDFVNAPALPRRYADAVAAGAVDGGNGSALDAGLRVAAQLLSKRRGSRAIVVLTDQELRTGWDNAAAVAALEGFRPDPLHVVDPAEWTRDRTKLTREDDVELAALARRYGGIGAGFEGVDAKQTKEIRDVALGLVRPIELYAPKLAGHAVVSELELPDVLPEGAGFRAMVQATAAPRALTLSGQLWTRPFRRVIRVDKGFSRATAAFVFGLDKHHDLSDTEMMKVARFGRAVSPVTSYLAIEPGVRPSTEGLDESVAMGRLGGRGKISTGAGGGGMGYVDYESVLRELLAKGVRHCRVKHPSGVAEVSLAVETTQEEVVDVTLTSKASPAAQCLVEAAWSVVLTSRFRALYRRTFHLDGL